MLKGKIELFKKRKGKIEIYLKEKKITT